MQSENKSEITFLVEDFDAVLETNKFLEEENEELKREVARLKAQIAFLKAHDIERKSSLRKKIQYPTEPKKNMIDEKNLAQNQDQVEGSQEVPMVQIKTQNSATLSIKKQEKSLTKGVPPPPPPLPSKSVVGSKLAVRRVPEVIEFYRYLSQKNAQMENRMNVTGISADSNPRNMIGEIENRSSYLSAVKSDVETQQEFINSLSGEVETTTFTEISAVDAFVKWLDGELSCLVDERAVLKHFPQWPERKVEALREASGNYLNLKNLQSEVQSFKENLKQPLTESLKRIQVLQDRLERVTNNIERIRDAASKRYKELQIPWNWMMDSGMLGQFKLSALKLAREYMNRVIKELHCSRCSKQIKDVVLQGARFAYRIHQFAGGFDIDTKHTFEELKQIHSTIQLKAF